MIRVLHIVAWTVILGTLAALLAHNLTLAICGGMAWVALLGVAWVLRENSGGYVD